MSITEDQYQEWDQKLVDFNFFGGDEPSYIDNEVFLAINGQEPPEKYLNLKNWYFIMAIFEPKVREMWQPPKQQTKKAGKKDKEDAKVE